MIRRLLRALGLSAATVPCWCGRFHRPGYWHDPTHGRIDRDIQVHARELLDLPPTASALSPGLMPIELAMQEKRDQGHLLYWERNERLRERS